MEDFQKDILTVLLKKIYTQGLINEDIYKAALDNTASPGLPDFIVRNIETGEEAANGPVKNTG